MSLLREIQEAAVSNSTSVAGLLRRCKILAYRLGSSEFGTWVDRELGGYPSREGLPEYRVAPVRSLGTFVGWGGSGAKNVPIPPSNIPEKWREHATTAHMTQPVGAYEDLVRDSDSGTYQSPWPPDLIKYVAGDIYQHMNLVSAWQEIPRGMVVELLDVVRNRVLGFALEIERVAPNAGEAAAGTTPVPPERVGQVFQTIIYGNVANVAAGSAINQVAEAVVIEGDFNSLTTQLEDLGLSTQDVRELEAALADDGESGERKIGSATGTWLGKALGKAGAGVLKISVNTASTLLPKLIGQYLGIPN